MCQSKGNIERILFYQQNYDVVMNYPLVAERPIYLKDHEGEEVQTCRFCGKIKGEVTFQKTAHAIPELIGNRSLISLNECDVCNEYFANNYEDHLAKSLGPLRSVLQIRGKKGVPSYKAQDIRIELKDTGLHFELNLDREKLNIPTHGPFKFKLPVDMPTQPYVPLRAAMALVKSACSVVPKSELDECQRAIHWLTGRSKTLIRHFPILGSFTPGHNPYGTGRYFILRRKTEEPIPYLWGVLCTSNYCYQTMIPFCPRDTWLNIGDSRFTVHHFPPPFDLAYEQKFGKTEFHILDWFSTDAIIDNHRNFSLNVERAERIDPPIEQRDNDNA